MSARAIAPRALGNPRADTFFAMLVVFPYYIGDRDQAERLSLWLRDLGGVSKHDCLLVIDRGTDESGVIEPLREAFASVETTFVDPVGAQGTWGTGTTDATAANEMFLAGANYVYHKKQVPFFWLEPDAAPTRSTWLDEIEAEYKACGKPFMGMLVNMPPHELHMSGVGCYPAAVANHSWTMMMPEKTAWDYAGRKDTVDRGMAHFTKLIQHEYRIHGESPTFPTMESLSIVRPETAVFHRCKESSLIDRLREKQGSQAVRQEAHNLPIAGSIPAPATHAPIMEPETSEVPATLSDQISAMAKSLARIAASKPERSEMVRSALTAEKINELFNEAPRADTKPAKNGKKKRTVTPERKAQLVETLKRAREVKSRKVSA